MCKKFFRQVRLSWLTLLLAGCAPPVASEPDERPVSITTTQIDGFELNLLMDESHDKVLNDAKTCAARMNSADSHEIKRAFDTELREFDGHRSISIVTTSVSFDYLRLDRLSIEPQRIGIESLTNELMLDYFFSDRDGKLPIKSSFAPAEWSHSYRSFLLSDRDKWILPVPRSALGMTNNTCYFVTIEDDDGIRRGLVFSSELPSVKDLSDDEISIASNPTLLDLVALINDFSANYNGR